MAQYPSNIPVGVVLSASITTDTGTQVKTGSGVLLGLSVITPQSGASATIYDGTSTSGTELYTVALTVAGPIVFPTTRFLIGLFIQTAGGTAATIKVANY
jgi:hypothetical protein